MENIINEKELAPYQEKLSKAEAFASAMVISTPEQLESAGKALLQIKAIIKFFTEKKESATKPMNEALKAIRSFFAVPLSQGENAEAIIKEKMNIYHAEEMAKAAKKTEMIEKKVESGKMSFDKAAEKIEAITPAKTIVSPVGSVQFKKTKEVVVEDESKVPDEYWELDLVKIRKVALAGVNIPGVRVVETQTVAGRSNY